VDIENTKVDIERVKVDIRNKLLSFSNASKLIKLLLDSDVITPVRGYGKGRKINARVK